MLTPVLLQARPARPALQAGLAPAAPPMALQGGHATGRLGPQAFNTAAQGLWVHDYEPEHRLYARGVVGPFAYVIAAGIVRFERVTAAGNRRITRVAGQGDLIGQEALLRQGYRDDAVACMPLTLHRLPASLLQEADWQAGLPPALLMSRWQDALDESEFWATELVSGPARRRVLQLLARLQQHRDADDRIWLPRREQMGDMLNITVETCSRVLSALRRESVLELLPPRHARLHWARLLQALQASNE
jgi:CRP/FNR family transcriptional regulator, anaerobic regulatory protein